MICLRSNKKCGKGQISPGQVLLEFTFSMIIVALMIYAIIMILRWAGVDLAERRIAHDEKLKWQNIEHNYSKDNRGAGPLRQIDPYFYTPIPMNAVWKP